MAAQALLIGRYTGYRVAWSCIRFRRFGLSTASLMHWQVQISV